MTRETIPRFDLYAELEVARSASRETIEAAYRSMAKRHHPDVADRSESRGSADSADARIKRINAARDWLTDPERRRRYDRALRRREGTSDEAADGNAGRSGRAANGAWTSEGGAVADEPTERGARTPSWTSFGPNTDRVREFLATLRDLDEARALQVRDGRASVDADDYAHARRAAFAISRSRRLSEWLFARDAAAAVVLGQLAATAQAGTPLATDVGETLAEVAGAIAVKDLLPSAVFDTLMEPWTWRGNPIPARTFTTAPPPMPRPMPKAAATRAATPPPAPVATRAPRSAAAPAAAARRPAIDRRGPLVLLTGSMAGLIVIATLVGASALFHPSFQGGVAGIEASHGSEPSFPPGAASSPESSDVPVGPTATPSSIDPALLASLRKSASATLANLRYDAAYGYVKAAQKYLGGTAPGLQASGLRRATFPSVPAGQIAIGGSTGAWTATAGSDTLTSADGAHWILDYGQRPLARFGKTSAHDLFWIGTSSNHDVTIRITSTTVSRSTVGLQLAWSYGPDSRLGSDAPYFSGTSLEITAITANGSLVAGATGQVADLGSAATTGHVTLNAGVDPRARLVVTVDVVNLGSVRGFSTISSEFLIPR